MLVHHISLVVRQTWVKSVEPPAQQLYDAGRPYTTQLHAVETCESNKIVINFIKKNAHSRKCASSVRVLSLNLSPARVDKSLLDFARCVLR